MPRDTPEFPLQSALVPPSRFRLAFELSHVAGKGHSLCRIDMKSGKNGEQLGLWVGPAPDFSTPNELSEWARRALGSSLHAVNVEYFGGEPF